MKETIYLTREGDNTLVLLRNKPRVWPDGSIGCMWDDTAPTGDTCTEESCDSIFPEAQTGRIYKYKLVAILKADDYKVDKDGIYITKEIESCQGK